MSGSPSKPLSFSPWLALCECSRGIHRCPLSTRPCRNWRVGVCWAAIPVAESARHCRVLLAAWPAFLAVSVFGCLSSGNGQVHACSWDHTCKKKGTLAVWPLKKTINQEKSKCIHGAPDFHCSTTHKTRILHVNTKPTKTGGARQQAG